MCRSVISDGSNIPEDQKAGSCTTSSPANQRVIVQIDAHKAERAPTLPTICRAHNLHEALPVYRWARGYEWAVTFHATAGAVLPLASPAHALAPAVVEQRCTVLQRLIDRLLTQPPYVALPDVRVFLGIATTDAAAASAGGWHRVACPRCQRPLRVQAAAMVRPLKCSGCALVFAVQAPGAAAPPATPALPSPLWNHTAQAIESVPSYKMFVFGGQKKEFDYSGTVSVLDTGRMVWTAPVIAGTPPDAREDCSVSYDAKTCNLVYFGGWRQGWLDDLWCINVAGIVGPSYASLLYTYQSQRDS